MLQTISKAHYNNGMNVIRISYRSHLMYETVASCQSMVGEIMVEDKLMEVGAGELRGKMIGFYSNLQRIVSMCAVFIISILRQNTKPQC